MLHVIWWAQYAMANTRGWVIAGRIARARLKAESELRQQLALQPANSQAA